MAKGKRKNKGDRIENRGWTVLPTDPKQTALDYAIQHHARGDMGAGSEEVVKTAETFYEYLFGSVQIFGSTQVGSGESDLVAKLAPVVDDQARQTEHASAPRGKLH